jgi:hypothetical protein
MPRFSSNPLFAKGLAFGMFCAKEAARATAGHQLVRKIDRDTWDGDERVQHAA